MTFWLTNTIRQDISHRGISTWLRFHTCDASLFRSLITALRWISARARVLFDPFNKTGLFAEIARVTKSGGIFLGTTPHHQWGLALRSRRGRSIDEAVFVLENGESIAQPSVLSQSEQLKDRLADVGFSTVTNEALKIPREVTNISPDIELPARIMKQSVYRIPIVQLVVAIRA